MVSWVKDGYVLNSMKSNDSHSSSDLFQEVLGEKDYGEWELIPSPKPTAEDKSVFGNFVSVYASFSKSFAIEALKNLKQSSNDVVLDPYSGAGTTLAAAGEIGLASHGFDLSPFSVVLGKLRFATKHAHLKDIEAELECVDHDIDQLLSQDTVDLFARADLRYLLSLLPVSGQNNVCGWLNQSLTKHDTNLSDEEYAFFCAVVAANKSAKVSTGSNPVWIRKLLMNEPGDQAKLKSLTKQFQILLCANSSTSMASHPTVQFADAREMPIDDASIDIALFSPPYLNRLDYFVNNLPTNMVLCDLAGIDNQIIRKDMIGSTKIRTKGTSPFPVGSYCQRLLNDIWNHPSKASRSYYYWNFTEYIKATYRVSEELDRVMKPAGRGAIVIQDSFYKDVRVLTHQIVKEAMEAQGFKCRIARRETVKGHMGRMSPRQIAYANEKTLFESVLVFSRC